MRWLALVIGAVLVAIAFVAAGQVADTQEGQVAEVVALLSGLVGVSLLIYAWAGGARSRPAGAPPMLRARAPVQIRTATELLAGAVGLVIALVLIAGVALSAGGLWVIVALVLLLPMILGSAYLCVRFMRAPQREWKIDLRQLTRR
ncbi:MAG TPA: hypothetical protein VNU19_14250 [Candidatus Acidoferrum sp.]|nr:hypothetical protein [Candidatus Acidoferrum sp.]